MKEFKGLANFCVYSQFADHFGDQLLAAAKVHDYLGFDPLGNIEVKTGGATGGHAVLAGALAIASGYANVVPVVGWERMDEVPTKVGNSYIASAADKDFESELGWMYASYYALMAQRYIHENHVPRETLAKIAIKNHGYAVSSPFSQNPMRITEKDVLENPMVSDPLAFLECCVMSTGAAALILADEGMAYTLSDHPVQLKAIASGTHTLRTADRRDMDILLLPNETPDTYKDYRETREWPGFSSFLAARMAAYLAYNMAGITDPVEELDLMETHDAFTISDIQTYEDVGLRPYGQGRDFIDSGDAYLGGRLPTLTLPPETVPTRVVGFGRTEQEAGCHASGTAPSKSSRNCARPRWNSAVAYARRRCARSSASASKRTIAGEKNTAGCGSTRRSG